jgi:glycosyltransferase involved in cell wall biosynthesis
MNKNSLPLVSIVMATYNGERFLVEQLNSLIEQSYSNIEIIAIDDGSTDNTISILNDYANRYENFTVFINETNLGYQKNFEKGFSLAKGDYIAPSDQDDIWLPNKIETLVNNIADYSIAYCNSAFMDGAGNLLGEKMNDTKTLMDFNSPLMYIIGASAPGHAMLIKKDVVFDAMPFPTLLSHDNWLGFIATLHHSLKFIDEVLVLYRRHDTNVFGSLDKKDRIKNNPKDEAQLRIQKAQQRLKLLYEKCPNSFSEEKAVFLALSKSYECYSLKNNFVRMCLFFKYRKEILAYKKHSELHQMLYCIKIFFKIL